MTSVRRLRPLAPLLAVVAAAGLLLPPPASAAVGVPASSGEPAVDEPVAGSTVTFLAHNVAGRTQGNNGRVDPVAGDLVRSIRRNKPYAGALNEICGNQARAVDRRLTGYRVEFFGKGRACPGGVWFGNAVLIRNGPVTRRRVDLPASEGSRELVCVSRRSSRIAACSTHLTAERDRGFDREAQARRVAAVTRGYVRRGFATYVGGDFNDQPQADTLDPMYRPAYGSGADGIYTESDGCCGRDGEPTLGTAKFDYGFVSWQWRLVRDKVVDAPHSDHDQLWTTVRRK
ncbi:endonuclease/exonuclease/phosphatase family protein [Nocardioides sp. CFH 31398]|uniref:endonuclease/exonuclease/phosphatase family protein n=1 Tax=Nocardioides sp. CFH 31398 TaxID=2919579 RepID=UPI001F0643CD|nr:endonuclease/exonuclease/phosphatase family protein [Nocardioides sp. CFH 31398]MCH1865050.1 endonuclease/exonuclease/phosphatase family protein [Nocardioides sp. CFH 31398]